MTCRFCTFTVRDGGADTVREMKLHTQLAHADRRRRYRMGNTHAHRLYREKLQEIERREARRPFATVFLAVIIATSVGLIGCREAHATTLVPQADALLAHQADLIVEGTVTKIASVETVGGHIESYITLATTNRIKGVTPDTITVVQPGGSVGNKTLVIPGSPAYRVGESVLVFLRQKADGTLETLDLALGKYQREGAEYVRDLDPDTVLGSHAPHAHRDRREAQAFRAAMKAAGGTAKPLRAIPERKADSIAVHRAVTVQQFAFFNNVRWFQPDTGQPISFLIDRTGDVKVGPTDSTAAIEAAFKAWTDAPASLVIESAGPSDNTGTFCDGTNKIIFNDPAGSVSDPNQCGGVLAIGGYCAGGATTTINGVTFHQVVEGDIIFNNGWEKCAFWNQTNMAEVATHELGHTLGLAHSSDATATMYAYAHFDGRGASLKPDDVAGIVALYPATSRPSPTPRVVPAPTPTATRLPGSLLITFNKSPAVFVHGERVEIAVVATDPEDPRPRTFITLAGPGLPRGGVVPYKRRMPARPDRPIMIGHKIQRDEAGPYLVTVRVLRTGREAVARYEVVP